jgi:RNA polymerase sigma-70 factor, ECF subfamily
VRQAMANLPEAQRTALALAYFDGRTQREVAEILNVPLGTVKTRMRDAMKKLRTYLDEGDE